MTPCRVGDHLAVTGAVDQRVGLQVENIGLSRISHPRADAAIVEGDDPPFAGTGSWPASRSGQASHLFLSASVVEGARRRLGFAVTTGGSGRIRWKRGCDADRPPTLPVPKHLTSFFHAL
jgi:hypothetical protein